MDQSVEQLKTDADKLLARWRELPARDAGTELRDLDKQAILALRAKGETQARIGEIVGCDQATVSRTLSALLDTRPLARAILEGASASMARNVAENGKPELHAKMLGKLDVIREDNERGVTVNTAVIVARADDPSTWLPEPVFEAETEADTDRLNRGAQ